MRVAVLVALVLSGATACAQANLWEKVSKRYDPPARTPTSVSDAQARAIGDLLMKPGETGDWDCEGSDLNDLVKGLTFEEIAVSDTEHVLLVEAGAGCGRGGQGANGAMWLMRFDGAKPKLLASPKDGFSGWVYSVEPSLSHGYHDVVLGWHMGARNAGLTYFRFDGTVYKLAGTALIEFDDDGNGKITPNP
jgi:hypothetical protein